MLEIPHRLPVFVNCDLLWSGHDEDTTDIDPTLLGGELELLQFSLYLWRKLPVLI